MFTPGTAKTDVLVLGGGGAGIRAAIEASALGAQVILVGKGPLGRSGLTVMAGGGVAAVMGNVPEDTLERHFQDTVEHGRHLNDENLVQAIVTEGPERIGELLQWGARRVDNPYLHKAGHSHPRGLFLKGDRLMDACKIGLARCSTVKVLEDHTALRILTHHGEAAGALLLDHRSGEFRVIQAKGTVIATGGVGELYALSTNTPHNLPGHAAGTGLALALEAGAEMVDMEMVQFYPSVVVYPHIARGVILAMEVLAGVLGAKVCNAAGEPFLESYFKDKPIVRDVVSRLVAEEVRAGRGTSRGGVFWDVKDAAVSPEEVMRIVEQEYDGGLVFNHAHLKAIGCPVTERLEFCPGAHHHMGGVRIDEWATTSTAALFAAGEVAGNAHGANRLAGNALTDTQVIGRRAGASAARFALHQRRAWAPVPQKQMREAITKALAFLEPRRDPLRSWEIRQKMQQVMDSLVGASRNGPDLKQATEEIGRLEADMAQVHVPPVREYNLEWLRALDLGPMLQVAGLIARCALLRTESRGCHQRSDYPEQDDQNWRRHTVVRPKDGAVALATCPVVKL